MLLLFSLGERKFLLKLLYPFLFMGI